MSAGWVGAIATVAGVALIIIAWAARALWRGATRFTRFLDDFFGEPARAGVIARSGVMARLQEVEKIVTEVRAETHKTAADVAGIRTDQAAMRSRMELFEHQREDRDRSQP